MARAAPLLLASMLERLVAGLVVIGLILWGASILATPTGDEPALPEIARESSADEAPKVEEPRAQVREDGDAEDDDDDEDDEDRKERKKRKRGRGG